MDMRGGKRPGSGRPRKENIHTITLRCNDKAYENFINGCLRTGLSQSDYFNKINGG